MNSAYGSNKYTDKQIEFVKDKAENSELTWEEIAKTFNKKFKKSVTSNALRHLYRNFKDIEPQELEAVDIQGPKILLFDVETAPLLGFVWSLWNNNVALNQLEKDTHLLSWSAKWRGSKEILYADQRYAENIEDDKEICEKLWKLLDEADIVVTHNGISFDSKVVNARFVIHGMKPPSTYQHIDTRRLAKKHFRFTSNKLEYLTNKLCKKYKKDKHESFSGFSMWKECLKGNIEAFKAMEKYNELDVLSLEELFETLIAWDNTIDFNTYYSGTDFTCTCGNNKLKKNGFDYKNLAKYQRYSCTKCGKEYRDSTNLHSQEKRKSIKRRTKR